MRLKVAHFTNWAALLVVYVVWGSTYLGIKIVVETLPPLLSAGSRFLVARGLLAALLAVRGTSLRVTPRELAGSALAGLLLLGLGVGVVHIAETRIDSSVAAMIAGTVPLQVILMRLTSRAACPGRRGSARLQVSPGWVSSWRLGLGPPPLRSVSR